MVCEVDLTQETFLQNRGFLLHISFLRKMEKNPHNKIIISDFFVKKAPEDMNVGQGVERGTNTLEVH